MKNRQKNITNLEWENKGVKITFKRDLGGSVAAFGKVLGRFVGVFGTFSGKFSGGFGKEKLSKTR